MSDFDRESHINLGAEDEIERTLNIHHTSSLVEDRRGSEFVKNHEFPLIQRHVYIKFPEGKTAEHDALLEKISKIQKNPSNSDLLHRLLTAEVPVSRTTPDLVDREIEMTISIADSELDEFKRQLQTLAGEDVNINIS